MLDYGGITPGFFLRPGMASWSTSSCYWIGMLWLQPPALTRSSAFDAGGLMVGGLGASCLDVGSFIPLSTDGPGQ